MHDSRDFIFGATVFVKTTILESIVEKHLILIQSIIISKKSLKKMMKLKTLLMKEQIGKGICYRKI